MADTSDLPIGLFDSGMGGLTVLAALRRVLPNESYVYLGDTARLPYGTKSPATVRRYALGATDKLIERGIKMLVVACNTASATALDAIRQAHPDLPVVGVVAPGAIAATRAAGSSPIAVLATESTVQGGAYQRALMALGTKRVFARSCPLLVTLAEEGRSGDSITRAVLEDYVSGLLASGARTLLLGCTHFPVFSPLLSAIVGPGVRIVDSAATTAAVVADQISVSRAPAGRVELLATDGVARFARVGAYFLGAPPGPVELIDL